MAPEIRLLTPRGHPGIISRQGWPTRPWQPASKGAFLFMNIARFDKHMTP